MDDDEIPKEKDAKLSRKEFAKQLRKKAYERAKEFRANDPKQVAFKEAMKQRRRDANEVAKEQRKAAARDEKTTARASRHTTTSDPDANDANARRAALRDEKATAREQLIALRAQTATAREELVAMRMLTAVAAMDDDELQSATTKRALGRDEQKLAERTALERRLLMKIVPASKL